MVPPDEQHEDYEGTPPVESPQQQPEVPVAPPRPELQIVDFSEKKFSQYCVVCGLKKDRYLEVEVRGVIEYTCKDCYIRTKGIVASPPATSCKKCGMPMVLGDNFCGKCGNPAVLRCTACNGEVDEEDKFCAKCGAKLFSAE